MSHKILFVAGALGAAVSGAIAVGGSAGAAGATLTLHLTAKHISIADTSKSTYVESSTLFKSGKKVGFMTQSCNDGGTNVKCAVTFALGNGILYGHESVPISTTAKAKFGGVLTGGLSAYTGDTGTIHVAATSHQAKVTLKYHS